MKNITLTEVPKQSPSKPAAFDWHKFAVTHDDLLSKDLPPLEFLVDGLIATPSLAILAAPKKRAKSWMALQFSQSVSAGAPFLGKTTKQGRVIHMALEDGERRLRQRLEMQLAPRGLPITYITHFEPLNTRAGFQQLEAMVNDQHPALLVLDTLAAAKNRMVDENSAGDTADLFNRLHDLALRMNMVILLVAHHGKPKIGTRDAGFDIRGSSAIPGATDVNIGLYKNEDGTFDLEAEGRDIGEVAMRIRFDAQQTWCWQYEGEAKDVRREEAEAKIIEAIAILGGKAEASTIADEIGITRGTAQLQLKRMRDAGTLPFELVKTGRWTKIFYSTPTSSTSSSSFISQHHQQCLHGVDDVDERTTETKQTHGVDDVGVVYNTGKVVEPLPYPLDGCAH